MKTIELPETPRQLHHLLARRLGIGALLVGSLAGGLAYWVESYRVEQRTLEQAIAGSGISSRLQCSWRSAVRKEMVIPRFRSC